MEQSKIFFKYGFVFSNKDDLINTLSNLFFSLYLYALIQNASIILLAYVLTCSKLSIRFNFFFDAILSIFLKQYYILSSSSNEKHIVLFGFGDTQTLSSINVYSLRLFIVYLIYYNLFI